MTIGSFFVGLDEDAVKATDRLRDAGKIVSRSEFIRRAHNDALERFLADQDTSPQERVALLLRELDAVSGRLKEAVEACNAQNRD